MEVQTAISQVQTLASPCCRTSQAAQNTPQSSEPDDHRDGVWLADLIRQLVETAPSMEALRMHRLHLAAARLWRASERQIPEDLLAEARGAAVRAMLARSILAKARSAYGGALMLMKGPEVAAHYPVSSDRPFRDIDLLAEDPEAAQRALIAAGFIQSGDPRAYADLHHMAPLSWPGLPLVVEVHRRPSQPFWLDPVSAESVLRTAVPSATGIPGLLAPGPDAHAVLVVAHAWNHEPLGSIGQLLDAATLLASADRRRASALAGEWGWEGMWNTTMAVLDGIFWGERPSRPVRFWARHLPEVRERTVLENHIARLAGPIWTLPRSEAARAVGSSLRYTASPKSDENWTTQLRRSWAAISHALSPRSQHERSLGWLAPPTRPHRPPSMRTRGGRRRDAISAAYHPET